MRIPSPGAWVLRLALTFVLIAAGCRGISVTPAPSPSATAPQPPVTPTAAPEMPTSTPAEESPAHGGTLVIGVPAEPDVLNFSLTRQPVSYWILSCLDARLIRIRDDNTLEPQLLVDVPSVDNGGISQDGRTYTLRFRPDLKWSDGEPLDGRDFLFTWQLLTNPSYPANSRAGWELIQSVELSDDYLTVTVHLERPAASFLEDVLVGIGERPGGFLLPAHALGDLPPAEIAESDYAGTGHVSSGPFVVAEWQPGKQLTLERNPLFEANEVHLDRIVFRFLPDERELLTQLVSGEIDLAAGLPEWSIAELHAQPELATLVTPRGGAVASLVINLNDPASLSRPHPILSDLKVRQALLFGFNRTRLVEDLLLGSVPVATSLLDHSLWHAEPAATAAFNPQRARRLLDEAGWHAGPDGIRVRDGEALQLTLAVDANPERDLALKRQIATAFADDMRAIGVDIRVVPLTTPASEREYDLLLCWCNRRLTPSDLYAWFSSESIPSSEKPGGENVMGYRSEVVDQLLTQQSVAVDHAARLKILAMLQQQIDQDLPVLPIYTHVDVVAGRTHVKGLAPGPMTGIWWNPESWWVSPQEATP